MFGSIMFNGALWNGSSGVSIAAALRLAISDTLWLTIVLADGLRDA